MGSAHTVSVTKIGSYATAAGPAPSSPAGVTLRWLLGRLGTILTIAAVVVGLAVAAWSVWPEKYKALALVALDPQTPQLTTERDGPPPPNPDGSSVVSLAEVATSDAFLIPLLERLDLVADPEFDDGIRGGAVGAAEQLRRNIKVGRRGLTFLIEITAQSKDPAKAARIANAIAEGLVQRQKSLRRDASGGIADAIQSRLADLRAAVVASEKAVADYRLQNNLLDVSPDGRVGLKRLNSMAEQVGPLRARLEEARARFEKLKKAKTGDEIDTNLFRSERMSELIAQRNEERRQMAAAARTYGPRHPSIDAAQARLTALDQSFTAERTRITEQAKAEVDILSAQLATYEAEIATRTREQLVTDQKEVVLRDLTRQMEADRQIYEKFLARQKSSQEQSDLAQPEAVIVSAAVPPSRSNRPSLAVVGVAALIGGLGAGVMVTLFRLRRPEAAPRIGRAEAPLAAPPPTPPDIAPAPVPAPPAPLAAVEAPPLTRRPAPPPPVLPVAERPTDRPIADVDAPLAAPPLAPAPALASEEAPLLAPTRVESPPPVEPAVAAPPTPVTPPTAPAADPVTEADPLFALRRRRRREPAAEAAPAPLVATPAIEPPPAIEPSVVAPEAPVAPRPMTPPVAARTPTAAVIDTGTDDADDLDERLAGLVPAARDDIPRRNPDRRKRRLLRVLEDHGVPLIADLTRPDDETPAAAVAAFSDVLAEHVDRAPGSTLLALAVSGASPIALAETLADAIETDERAVAVVDDDGPDPIPPAEGWDLVVACSDARLALAEAPPSADDFPFVLLVVDVLADERDTVDAVLARWTADPDRTVVAAFDLGRAPLGDG